MSSLSPLPTHNFLLFARDSGQAGVSGPPCLDVHSSQRNNSPHARSVHITHKRTSCRAHARPHTHAQACVHTRRTPCQHLLRSTAHPWFQATHPLSNPHPLAPDSHPNKADTSHGGTGGQRTKATINRIKMYKSGGRAIRAKNVCSSDNHRPASPR